MNAKTLQTTLVDLLKRLASGIKEVEFCIGFKQLKQAENSGHSYVIWSFLSESEADLKDAITRLSIVYLKFFILLSELKDKKQKSGMSEIFRKYSPLINELGSKANRLLREVG